MQHLAPTLMKGTDVGVVFHFGHNLHFVHERDLIRSLLVDFLDGNLHIHTHRSYVHVHKSISTRTRTRASGTNRAGIDEVLQRTRCR